MLTIDINQSKLQNMFKLVSLHEWPVNLENFDGWEEFMSKIIKR